MSKDYFVAIDQPVMAEYKDRGSRFIGYAFPVTSLIAFKEKLAQVKKEHPKATHHCFAYRLGIDGSQFRVSDDGEPAGSAGRPILGQLDSRELTDTVVIVVRYFGGTLLGVPGLIQAYKSAAAMALQLARTIRYPVLVHYRLQFDYTQVNTVRLLLKKFDCQVNRQQDELFCLLETGVPRKDEERWLEQLQEIRNIQVEKITEAGSSLA